MNCKTEKITSKNYRLDIPDDLLNIIGDFAGITIETKKYKSKQVMKISKIKYKCFLCGKCKNKNQISKDICKTGDCLMNEWNTNRKNRKKFIK